MSVKYFTGSNDVTGGGKNQHNGTTTVLTSMGLPETEPSATNADGIDVKPNRDVDSTVASKYVRMRRKVYSKTTDTIGKSFANNVGCRPGNSNTRVSLLNGKYELGKMWKWRKTLKKLFTATGIAAQANSKGERNMYNGKNNGRVGGSKHGMADASGYVLYPIDQLK
jgi:hypothetical protein